jgi:hypothetical protein
LYAADPRRQHCKTRPSSDSHGAPDVVGETHVS